MINSCKNVQQNTLVKSFEGNKLKNVSNVQLIADLLTELFVLSGLSINNYPNDNEEALLIRFVHGNFENYTINEIRLAFTLAVKRDLIPFMGKNADVSHYQNFSVEYFCKIMTGYRKYKAHQLTPLLAKVSNLPTLPEISDYDFLKSNLVDQFDKFKAGHYPWGYGADVLIFDILVKNEIINVPHADKIKKGQEVKKSLNPANFENSDLYKAEWLKIIKIHFYKIWIDEVVKMELDLLTIITNKCKTK